MRKVLLRLQWIVAPTGTISNETTLQTFKPEVEGEYQFILTDKFIEHLKEGDKIKIGGVEFTAVDGGATVANGEFNIGSGDANTILTSLKGAIENNTSLNTRFDITGGTSTVSSNVLTLKEVTVQITGTDLADKNVVNETLSESTLEVTKMFVPGEQIKIAGETFTFVDGGADLTKGQINVGSTLSNQASNIKEAF